MTSFLTDVLVTAGEVEKVNLEEKVSKVQKEVTKLKNDVKTFMDDNYIEFLSKLKDDQILVTKAQKLIEEIESLETKINDEVRIELSGLTDDLKGLSRILKESIISLCLSHDLLALHECIKSIDEYEAEKKYIERAKALQRMRSLLDDASNDLQDLDVYSTLREKYRNSYGVFLSDAASLWRELICWTESDNSNNGPGISLVIKEDSEMLKDFFGSLHHSSNLSDYLNKFAITLIDNLLCPIIRYRCSVYVKKECMFVVEALDKEKQPSYQSVLYNLKLLFKFLHRHFDMKIDNECLLSKLRPHLLTQMSDMLITNCISLTIPNCSAELIDFEEVIDAITEFQDYLIEIGFLSKEELFLSEYTKNVDKLFVDKMCIDFLAKARNIAKKDLHDSVFYTPKEPLVFPFYVATECSLSLKKALFRSTFELPRCLISKSAVEIAEVAKDILEEAHHCPEACAIKLFYTCRNVFEMYTGLTPEHHQRLLEVIPQQVAIFHNNCMYLAHKALILAFDIAYSDELPDSLKSLNMTFADQSVKIRKAGTNYFLEHMKYQKSINMDILRESGLAALGQSSELHPGTERALRQCIRQLELLKSVWFEVLPNNVYCRAIGCIADSMVEDIVTRIITVEDIPASVASELVVLFNMVANRLPPIFPKKEDIHYYVGQWDKFLELIKVLGASLKEIQSRWGNKQGPLAKQFKASEIKQLIRALFQNTERRSALLLSIK